MLKGKLNWRMDKQTEKYANDIIVYLRTLDRQTKQLMKDNTRIMDEWRKELRKYDRV